MRTTSIATATLLALTGCWTPQHSEQAWSGFALERSRVEGGASFEPGEKLARPVAERESVAGRPGDSVVYAIEVQTPSVTYRRYLRFTVLELDGVMFRNAKITQTMVDGTSQETRFFSQVFPVHIELFDAEGQPLGESTAQEAMVDLLARGFVEACEANLEYGSIEALPSIEERLRVSLLDAPAIFSIGFMLQSDTTLYDLAFDLVDKSLALTALWNFGISFTIEPKLFEAEPIESDPVLGVPGWRFPVQFKVNGRPALRIAATVVEPQVPVGLTAGITRVDGFRATDDRYRFRVQLVPSLVGQSLPAAGSDDE